MCFATKKMLEKLRSYNLNIQTSWTLQVELQELQIGQRQTLRACLPCGTHSRYRPLSRRVPNQSDTLANPDFFFPFFPFFIELKIMVSIF